MRKCRIIVKSFFTFKISGYVVTSVTGSRYFDAGHLFTCRYSEDRSLFFREGWNRQTDDSDFRFLKLKINSAGWQYDAVSRFGIIA
mgnify:CR=1 FL=1